MLDCVPLTREMLRNPIEIRIAEGLDFQRARDLAQLKAGEVGADPMLLAWFDRARGALLPQHHLLPGGQTLLADLRRITGRGYRHQLSMTWIMYLYLEDFQKCNLYGERPARLLSQQNPWRARRPPYV